MNKIIKILLFVITISCVLTYCSSGDRKKATDEPLKPNIVIIFTDDQGYADLGCFGNTVHKTPRLDQLAKEGMRFTSFYAQHVCGPSRSALLTGRYPIRSKGWSMPAGEITWAELLKNAGYQTDCIGKWDVSNRKPIIERMPNAQGFDYYFGTLGANDQGESKEGNRDNFFYVNAYRKGKWKYLAAEHTIYEYSRDNNRKIEEELYDLSTDIGETNNLANQYPEKVAELRALMEKEKEDSGTEVLKKIR